MTATLRSSGETPTAPKANGLERGCEWRDYNRAVIHKRFLFGLLLVAVAFSAGHWTAGGGGQAGSSGAIVFERAGDLFAVAVDSSRAVRLTKSRIRELEPAVSPDGRFIAYASGGGLWTMSVDGERRTRLTRGNDTDPAWSPDGSTIFFSRWFPDRFGASCGSIFSIHTDRRDLRRLTRSRGHSHYYPAVSADGRRVAFTDADQCEGGTTSYAVHVVDISGRRTNDLARLPGNRYYPTREYEDPAWSPDGRRIAFLATNLKLHVASRDGSGLRRVTPRRLVTLEPAWSRDGRWIAFVSHDDVYVIHLDGTGLRRLTRTKATESSPAWLTRMPSG